MAKVLVTDTYLSNIANMIRRKLNTSDTYTPPQMASAVEKCGGDGISIEKNVTLNTTSAYATLISSSALMEYGIKVADIANYRITIEMYKTDTSETTKQVVFSKKSNIATWYASGAARYGIAAYHNTAVTSFSLTSSTAAIGSTTAGYPFIDSSGIRVRGSTTLGYIGTYKVIATFIPV